MPNPSLDKQAKRPSLSRRHFLSLLAAVGGIPLLGQRSLEAAVASIGDAVTQARRLLPSFSAHAGTFGALIGSDGKETTAPAPTPGQAPEGNHRWVMVIDLARCDGCRVCTDACTEMHHVPAGQEWIHVIKMQDPRTDATYWMPKPCFQCDNSPCTKVCPVSATYKREDGVVLIDQNRCIGCRYCMAACPYSTRWFNWVEPAHTPDELAMPYDVEMNLPHRKGVAEKCLFCPSLLRRGRLPACAEHCSMGAIYAGDELEDLVVNSRGETYHFKQLLQENGGYRFLEELGTHPRVWYLPPRGRKFSPPRPDPDRERHG